MNIIKATTVMAVSLLALDYILVAPNVYGEFFFGKITIVLYWFLQLFFPRGRARRVPLLSYTRTLVHARREDNAMPTWCLAVAADADVLLRAIESGPCRSAPVGILSRGAATAGSRSGRAVLGEMDDLERVVADFAGRDINIARLILRRRRCRLTRNRRRSSPRRGAWG